MKSIEMYLYLALPFQDQYIPWVGSTRVVYNVTSYLINNDV